MHNRPMEEATDGANDRATGKAFSGDAWTRLIRILRNKAGYTATPVVSGWAGTRPYLRSLEHLGRSSEA